MSDESSFIVELPDILHLILFELPVTNLICAARAFL